VRALSYLSRTFASFVVQSPEHQDEAVDLCFPQGVGAPTGQRHPARPAALRVQALTCPDVRVQREGQDRELAQDLRIHRWRHCILPHQVVGAHTSVNVRRGPSSDRRFPHHAPPHWLHVHHPATYGWVIPPHLNPLSAPTEPCSWPSAAERVRVSMCQSVSSGSGQNAHDYMYDLYM